MIRFKIVEHMYTNNFEEEGKDYLLAVKFNNEVEKEYGIEFLNFDEDYPYVSLFHDEYKEFCYSFNDYGNCKITREDLTEEEKEYVQDFYERFLTNN